jgi:DNA-binding MarR family transcriptional regulator
MSSASSRSKREPEAGRVRLAVVEGASVERLDEAMELMHFAWRRVIEAPDQALAKRGMGRLHHRLLYVIGHNSGIDVGQTVALLGITKQAAHGPLKDLLDQGLVEVTRPNGDRRRKQLALTASGRGFERRLARMQHDVFEEAFAAVGGSTTEAAWRAVMNAMGRGRRLRVDR